MMENKKSIEFQLGCMTFEDWLKIEKDLKTSFYPSKLNVFKKTFGYRKAELSTIIAPYGNGKSTFTRTSIIDFLDNKTKVLVILSEEKCEAYKKDIWMFFYFKTHKNEEETNKIMSKLVILSFMEGELSNVDNSKALRSFLNEFICTEEIEAVFFDNFTTSPLGNASITDQGKSVIALKKVAVEFDIPIVLVLHTEKGTNIYNDTPTGENVRGNAASANIGSYNYIVVTFFKLKVPRAFVVIDKSRYHSDANKKVFELTYDKDLKIYISDKESSFEELENAKAEASPSKSRKRNC